MTVRNLHSFFKPRSVALIGASERPHSVGATVLQNLLNGGFGGAIYAVNPRHGTVAGQRAYARVADLPAVPDLAVICTPPQTVPELIAQLGECGTRAAIVLTAGLSAPYGDSGKSVKQAMLDAARPNVLRILGPNCLGLLVPGIGLNASFSHTGALPGRLAFVSQSGALMTGVLDWAKSSGIGFSCFVSLGDSADADFGDLLDYLGSDASTQAILLYIEDIRHARKFMSAARAAARNKPIVVVKAGRAPEGARAAASHTGALAGSDDVYDAAIRRAGMLRVLTTEDLFGAVETLARAKPLHGEQLAIMTNGGGPGVMATDALVTSGGKLTALSGQTLGVLDECLPVTWSHGNPVDIIGDAPAERYAQALQVLLHEPQADAILLIHAPSAIVSSTQIAEALVPLAQASSRNVLSCWLGHDTVARARQLFTDAGLPTYDTPEAAVNGFMQIVQYRRNQQLLMEVPAALPDEFVPDLEAARGIVRAALDVGRDMLTEPEAKRLLAAYGVPIVDTRIAGDVDEAVQCAQQIGFPVALKVLSPDITHKTDVGGVVLDLETADEVRHAAQAMQQRLRANFPQARLNGFSVQTMARRPHAQELIVGVASDPVFGPVILFGQGGIAVEVMADRAIGLPPLNMVLAREMISRTRVAKLLAGYRDRAPADIDAVCSVLIRIAQLVADIAEIAELDINPLLADSQGVIALDARVRVTAQASGGRSRFAIRAYPNTLEERVDWHGEQLLLRPIRPEDGPAHMAFFNTLDAEDVHSRAFMRMRELKLSQLARLTQIDYDREMAFIATRQKADGTWETLGVARGIADPDNQQAEFAVIVRSDIKGKGLGKILMGKLIAYCRGRGTRQMVGETLRYNKGLIRLAQDLGFTITPDPEDPGTMLLRLQLNAE